MTTTPTFSAWPSLTEVVLQCSDLGSDYGSLELDQVIIEPYQHTISGIERYEYAIAEDSSVTGETIRQLLQRKADKAQMSFDEYIAWIKIPEMESEIPYAQLQSAQALARKYGHAWASCIDMYNHKDGTTPQKIRDEVKPQIDPLGSSYPQIDDASCIVHESGQSRLRWCVWRDGAVEIVIQRPQGDVITATIDAEMTCNVTWNNDVPMHCRHFMEIRHALSAFYDWKTIDELTAPLAPCIVDDVEEVNNELPIHSWLVYPVDELTGGVLIRAQCEHDALKQASALLEKSGKIVLLG